MNLYLKYRPKTIEELDLEGVRKTLSEIVKANKVAHAYLLTGPRGAGKTSTARVLARIVNCEKNGEKLGEPCNACSACKSILDGSAMDVIEIDAASNRGIDDIRELKEKIRLAPSVLSRKVYIIDEVHMLTTEAFNALLKTLEEPPSHSLFILCTTELHKVPETIVSRCVQIHFTKATPSEMQRSFARVVLGEGKKVSDEALLYLAKSVDGSFRDGVKILDQVLSMTAVAEIDDIELVVSGSSGYKIMPFIEALASKNLSASLASLAEAVKNGVDMNYLLLGIMRGLRDKLLQGETSLDVTKFIFNLDEVARRQATSLDGELLLQVAIVEWCDSDMPTSSGKKKIEPANDNQAKKTIKVEITQEVKPTVEAVPASVREEVAGEGEDAESVWRKVVGGLGSNNLALDTILSKARPGKIHGDELTVYVSYDFHRQQLMSEKNLVKFEEIITKAVGRPMRVNCLVQPNSSGEKTPLQPIVEDHGDTIEDAIAIFTN
jgi:DNA polymerase-3 subunit gamma/tau